MTQLFTNNASGTLSVQAEIGHTTLTLQSSEGPLFPTPTGSDFFQVSIEDTGGNLEICTCTSRSGDVLTVTRGQENTSAQVFATGSRVEIRLTAATHDSFLQVYGGVMQGTLDMDNNFLNDPNMSGGQIRNTPIRGTDGGTANQIVVPTAAGAPTIGGLTIIHAGNDGDYALGATLLNGSDGISAIGDLSEDRDVKLAVGALSTIEGNAVAADDRVVVHQNGSNTHKAVVYKEAGFPITPDSGTNPTPTSDQVNSYWVCSNASPIDFQLDNGVGKPGNVIIVQQGGAGIISFTSGSALINSAYTNDATKQQFSVAVFFCTSQNIWTLYGDLT